MENNITIKMDTREKVHKKKNILAYFERNNIDVERIKLDVGDYCIKGKENVVIDTKRDLTELATNMFCDSVRFQKECIRAKNNNIILIFLIEENFDKEKLLKWKAKEKVDGKRFLNVQGWQVYNQMKLYSQLFRVKFRFCHKLSTGKQIVEILEKYTKVG